MQVSNRKFKGWVFICVTCEMAYAISQLPLFSISSLFAVLQPSKPNAFHAVTHRSFRNSVSDSVTVDTLPLFLDGLLTKMVPCRSSGGVKRCCPVNLNL